MSSTRQENLERSRKLMRGSPPRRVRVNGFWKGRRAWGDMAFILGVFLFFFVLLTYNVLPLAAEWWGLPAQAQVVDKKLGESHGFSFPILRVWYLTGAPPQNAYIDTISRKFFDQLQPKDVVSIHYLPAFPGKPSLDTDPPSLWLLSVFLLTLPFPWAVILWDKKQKNLIVHGWLVEGAVTAIVKKYVFWEWKAKMAEVEFEWKGKIYKNTSTFKNYGAKNKVGDPMLLLVNPVNPEDNVVYDDTYCGWRPVKGLEEMVT